MGEYYAETQAKELRDPFWKDILVSWKKFCNLVPIEKNRAYSVQSNMV